MPWFRVDDTLDTHPKAVAAGNEALGLWVRCGAYAARHLTDGFIPENIAILYGAAEIRSRGDAAPPGTETLAETLVRTKLWRRARGGWRMHDYNGYNPTKQEVNGMRAKRAEAGRKGGLASGKTRSKTQANASRLVEPPSHPIPEGPLTPAADAAGGHHGQHKHCRACGTNLRGRPPPTPLPPQYEPPSVQPARGETVARIAAQAREAITCQESP